MVKKSIIALALICMLATVSFAQDGTQYSSDNALKIDGLWPAQVTIKYSTLEICRFKVYIKVGMFIQIENCQYKKIVLEQVNCPGGQSFPCYKGCTQIKVRSNFEAKLTLQKYKIGNVIDQWKVYFWDGSSSSNDYITTPDGNYHAIDVCVEAWDTNIYNAGPNTEVLAGEIAILAVPTATPDCSDYCD